MSNAQVGFPLRVLEVVESVGALRRWRVKAMAQEGREGARAVLGLVPTMGYLHNGHLSLVEQARRECDFVVVSIFVNPLQFAPTEDFDQYPRDFERDHAMLEKVQVDCIFSPSAHEIYGDLNQPTTRVLPPKPLISNLCGEFRPGHFEGVATIVAKLFNIVQPDFAYFGEKDFQQLMVIKQMVNDLNFNLEIKGVPIVRERDGLAMSSRNVYLSAEGRKKAPLIHEVLRHVEKTIQDNGSISACLAEGKRKLTAAGFEVQYLEACRFDNLIVTDQIEKPMVVLCAAKLDGVRLIDNIIIT